MIATRRGQRHRGIRAVDVGQGEPVLLLHGIGSSACSFEPQIERLSQTHRVVVWDAPGYAGSADPAAPPGMDGYANVAATLLGDLGIGSVHVVGLSWGGVVATRLALRRPQLVRSLVLADTTVGSGADPARAAAMQERGDELARMGALAVAHRRAPRLLSAEAPPALVRQVKRTMGQAIRMPGYAWAAEAMATTDHRDQLAGLALPVLVLVGEHDTVTSFPEADRLASAIPGARLRVVPGAGHLSNQEQPEAFNDLLLAFLDEVTTTRSSAPQEAIR